MHEDHQNFIDAIHQSKKVELQFRSKDDGGAILTRKCAPMDHGPSRRAHDDEDRYHFWDYESDEDAHTLSLKEEQIVSIDLLDETFDPSEFVTWDTDWFVERDWGQFS